MINRNRFNILSDAIMKWCIYAIVFAAPFSKSISEAAIAIAIGFWLVKKIVNADARLVRTDLNIPLLIFVIAIIPSLFNSAYPALSIKAFFTKVLKFVLLYFVMVETIDNKDKLRGLFIVSLMSIGLILMDGLIQYHITGVDILHKYPSFKTRPANDADGFYRGFPTASFPFPNDFAAWILLVVFPLICVTIFDIKGKKIRYITTCLALGLIYLFFLAKARGAWVGLMLSTAYIALSKNKVWLILLLVLIMAIPFVLKMEMAKYIFSFGSIGDRFGMWNTGWRIFKNHPIIGNGLNTFFELFKKYRQDEWRDKKGSYAHNCYLQMASDIGVVGLVAFLWLIFSYFHSIIKNLKNIGDKFYNSILWGISIGVFAFLIHSFFDTNLYSLNLATLFWFAIGSSQAILKVSLKKVDA